MRQRPCRSRAAWMLGVSTLLLTLMLILQCIRLYFAGIGPDNQIAAGVFLQPVYAPESIAVHARPLLLPLILWLCSLAACLIGRKPAERLSDRPIRLICTRPGHPVKHLNALRITLLCAAIGLIISGIWNGGMYDVLVKAINLCTECIGLG